MQFCTLSGVKAWLDISDESQDVKLSQFIQIVSAKMAAYLGYDVAWGEYIENYPVTNRQYLVLRHRPIQAIDSVSINGIPVYSGTGDADYRYTEQDAAAGLLYRGIGWTGRYFTRNMTYDPVGGARDILISYTAGWHLPDDVAYSANAPTSLPGAIVAACTQEVVTMARKNEARAEGLSAYSEGGISWKWDNGKAAGLSDETMAVLDIYRKRGMA